MKRILSALIVFILLMMTACGSMQNTPSGQTETDPVLTADPSGDSVTSETDPAEDPPVTKHVVIVGVDGGGAFFKDADTPNLDRIMENGSVTYRCLTSKPTISAQCWGSMLHGVTPNFHKLTNGVVEETPFPEDSQFPSVFRVIRENMPEAELASFCNWNPINVGIIEEGLDVKKDTGRDAELTEKICEYLGQNEPTLLFIQFDEVDGAGHSNGYGSDKHLAQIATTDGYINKIYNALGDRGILDETLFIVTADHGGTPESTGGSHGGWTEAERYIMFAAVGPGIEPGETGEMEVRDIASIVLYALGLIDSQPKTWTSRVPSGVFSGVEASERPLCVVDYDYEHRTHENVPTPEIGESAAAVFGTERVHAYLPFDGNVTDATGNNETSANGKIYYVEGYFGDAIQFDDGYVSLPDQAFGTDSFSVAFWLKTEGVANDPPIISNKDWENGQNSGFAICLNSDNELIFNIAYKGLRTDLTKELPSDFPNGWVYAVLVLDREAKELRISFDFGEFTSKAIPGLLGSKSIDALPALNIGQDGTGNYGASLSAAIDDILIIDGVITEDDIARLKEIYTGSSSES